MDISGCFEEIMIQYNKNIRDYNDNMRIYLEIMQNRYEHQRQSEYNAYETPPRRTLFRNHIREPLFDDNQTEYLYTYFPSRTEGFSSSGSSGRTMRTNTTVPLTTNTNTNLINTLFRNFFPRRNAQNLDNLVDVTVRPTDEVIRNATETIVFNSLLETNTNTSCPITLEPFTNGERICRIKHCSHLFKQDAIMDWFQRNVRCPVCRYDIRDYVSANTSSYRTSQMDSSAVMLDAESESDSEIETEVEQEETTDFSDAVEELLQESMAENQQRVRTEVPAPNPPRAPRTTPLQNRFQNSPFANNLTSAIRNFVNNEINHLPFDINSAAELLYTFDIPITFDISGNARI